MAELKQIVEDVTRTWALVADGPAAQPAEEPEESKATSKPCLMARFSACLGLQSKSQEGTSGTSTKLVGLPAEEAGQKKSPLEPVGVAFFLKIFEIAPEALRAPPASVEP